MTLNKKFVIIFSVIFVVFSVAALIINTVKPEENIALISIDGEVVREINLENDTAFLLESENGTNSIEVKNGTIYITDATCPDKLCVRHGELHNKFDAIVCLPNKVVIEYKNGASIDAVAGR